MTNIVNFPSAKPAVTQEDLNKWYVLCAQLGKVKKEELELRNKIFGGYFTAPTEGVNTAPLSDGWVIKGTHVINRSVDKAALTINDKPFREAGIVIEDVVEMKPSLKVGAYKKLTDAQRKLFDIALTITPGTPQLEIVKPKR